jgi:hypothetical protein
MVKVDKLLAMIGGLSVSQRVITKRPAPKPKAKATAHVLSSDEEESSGEDTTHAKNKNVTSAKNNNVTPDKNKNVTPDKSLVKKANDTYQSRHLNDKSDRGFFPPETSQQTERGNPGV